MDATNDRRLSWSGAACETLDWSGGKHQHPEQRWTLGASVRSLQKSPWGQNIYMVLEERKYVKGMKEAEGREEWLYW